MKTFEVRIHIRAENEADARELLECFEETHIHVLQMFRTKCKECDE
jgi:hypothetical protein